MRSSTRQIGSSFVAPIAIWILDSAEVQRVMKTFVRSALKEVAMPRMFHRFVVGTIVLGFVLVTAPAPARASVSSGKSGSFAAKVESWLGGVGAGAGGKAR